MRVYGLKREMSPTTEQRIALGRHVGAVRFAQNEMLRYIKENLENGTQVSWTAISLHTAWRARRDEVAPWYAECSKEAYQDGCARLALALRNWADSRRGKRKGKKSGFPRFRKRGVNDSWTFTGGRVSDDGWAVRVPRIGLVRLAESVEVPAGGRVSAITIRERAGRWFATVRVREDLWTAPKKKDGGLVVGVDLGVGDRLAVLHDSDAVTTEIDNPRFFRADEKKIARAARNVSRKKKGSANRRKARRRLAKVMYAVACRRQDYLHKFTTDLVKTHDRIVLEDLNVAGMSRRGGFRLGKSVADVAMAEIRRQVTYKCEWYGTDLVVVDRWYASSKECSACGTKNPALELGDREWCCLSCGTLHDRDVNAARNLMLAGSSPVSACGADVRHGIAAQTASKQEVLVADADGI